MLRIEIERSGSQPQRAVIDVRYERGERVMLVDAPVEVALEALIAFLRGLDEKRIGGRP